jgi:dTDP-4-amino-4,6-dideoxygalactose transaminase
MSWPGNDGRVPLFRASVARAVRERVLATLDSGWLGYGPECRLLEQRFTDARGGWALATSSCTSALYLAGRLVRTLCGEPAPEIIIPSISFVASGMAFAQAGLRTVVAEVCSDTLLLDAGAAARAVTPRTRALLVVHLYGQRHPELPALRALADLHGLLLIEDCAHRIDLLDDDAPAGDLLCYSFNAVKELPAGEGGLIWGRDAEHEGWLRAVSNLGLTVDTMQRAATPHHADYAWLPEPGLKLRSNDLAATLVNAAFGTLAASRAQRCEQARRYDRWLVASAPIVRPLPRSDDDSFLMYVVKLAPALRDDVRAALAAAGIASSVHYPSLARHPLLGDGRTGAACEDQDAAVMTLPTFLDLGQDVQRRVVDTLARSVEVQCTKSAGRAAAAAI